MKIKSEYFRAVFFLSILLGAFYLRASFNGVIYEADEGPLVEKARALSQKGGLDPDFYNHPNHLGIYLNAALYKLAGPDTDHFRITRYVSAVFGTLSAVAAFLIASLFNNIAGWLALVIFAVFAPYVLHSHFATCDIQLTTFVLFSMFFLVRYLKAEKRGDLIGSCVMAACATSTKYPGLLCLFTILGCMVLKTRKREDLLRKVSFAAIIFVVSLFLMSPYLFLRPFEVLRALVFEASPGHLGQDGLAPLKNMKFYVQHFLLYGLALVPFIILGIYATVREKMAAVPLAIGLVFWLSLSQLDLHWLRWAMPMYVTPLLIAALGMAFLLRNAANKPIWRKGIVVSLCLISLGLLSFDGLKRSYEFAKRETRDVAETELRNARITEENSIFEGYTPFAKTELRFIFDGLESRQAGKEYVVLSSLVYDRFLGERDRYPKESEAYDRLFSSDLVTEIRPGCSHKKGQLAKLRDAEKCLRGPTIKVFRLPASLRKD